MTKAYCSVYCFHDKGKEDISLRIIKIDAKHIVFMHGNNIEKRENKSTLSILWALKYFRFFSVILMGENLFIMIP